MSSPLHPCAGCGASLVYEPGTIVPRCTGCGQEQRIARSPSTTTPRTWPNRGSRPRRRTCSSVPAARPVPRATRSPRCAGSAAPPWPLERAVPFEAAYVAGHHSPRYDSEPQAGLEEAKAAMAKVINGVSGEVHGDRPYSAVKIILLGLAVVALVAGEVWLYESSRA